MGRGNSPNPRQPALVAYRKAHKAGADPAIILVAVKARTGDGKPDTLFAPQMSTWLNQERWVDGGDDPVMTAGEIETRNQRLKESEAAYNAQIAQASEERRRQLGIAA
jgi:hypothetical protein